jgi:hypothetical protein
MINHYDMPLDTAGAAYAWSVVTSAFMFGAVIGCFTLVYVHAHTYNTHTRLCSPVTGRLGPRTACMIFKNVLIIISSVMYVVGTHYRLVEVLIVGR